MITKYGLPGPDHTMLFNGDFVDRGEHGVEVMLVLCAFKVLWPTQTTCLTPTLVLTLTFKVLYPEYMHMNRGNHEDVLINEAYSLTLTLTLTLTLIPSTRPTVSPKSASRSTAARLSWSSARCFFLKKKKTFSR